MASPRYIGLMSGTSLDGVDAVLADAESRDLAFCHLDFPPALRAELLALNRSGPDELHRSALAANALSRLYAQAVSRLLTEARLPANAVTALGAHGQTVRHQPQATAGDSGSDSGYSCQLLNGALLAEISGIDVVCDLRSRDVAAGGQGAPLVPAFHAARFAQAATAVAVLNLGGMANLSLLPADGQATGFDCGPGNVLIDQWCQLRRGAPFDTDGAWAAQGQVHAGLLATALAEPFYALPAPKSTGRELFDDDWVRRWLATANITGLPDEDVAATLTQLTAATAAQALMGAMPQVSQLLVCGGGARNSFLLSRLSNLLGPKVQVRSTEAVGVAPDRVEALAFAWLAQAFVARRPGNLPAVTGARGPRILGALYPAD